MKFLEPHKVGLSLGVLLGFLHVCWSVLVALGFAKPLLDFIFRVHFMEFSYSIAPFGFGRAITLIVATSIVGYLAGWMFATIWNWFHKNG